MAKKTFKDNPALQFITTPEEEPAEEVVATKKSTTSKKKEAPEGYKVNPEFIEVKSRRVQLVLQPSLYDKVKARAKASGVSVNEYVHSILEEATREE